MLTFVCWKWKNPRDKSLPLSDRIAYTHRHVNILENMLKRHVKIEHQLVCMTDDPRGINCKTLPIPMKYAELGGCYRRLWMFSEEAKDILGDKIVSIDLDCVILGDITDLFTGEEIFITNTYQGRAGDPDQYYNGGLMMHRTGTLSHLWTEFDETKLPELKKFMKNKCAIGTDQAWIRYMLGKKYTRWGNEHGVYEARQIKDEKVPANARFVLFAGKRDPSLDRRLWVRKNWS